MVVPLVLVAVMAATYLGLAVLQRASTRGWNSWRTAAFCAGCGVLVVGLVPAWMPFPAGDFREHMLAHLAIGMIAPIGLVLGAPVKLVLRSISAHKGRTVSALLDSAPARFITNPVTALVLDLGGMAALYFTPLYSAMMQHPALHYAVHAHFLAAGCLYSWVIAGDGATRHQTSVPTRLAVLGTAIVAHSVMSQLLYAGAGVAITLPVSLRERGAELMYYGGDISELLLAIALVTTWRPRRKETFRYTFAQRVRW